MRRFAAVSLMVVLLSAPALAIEGYDAIDDSEVEIETGAKVVEGGVLNVFDYSDDSVHRVEVLSVHRSPQGIEVEVFDFDDADYRVFLLDGQTTGALLSR